MNEIEKSYLAGIIDGEGSIQISRRTEHRGTERYQYWLSLSIANTNTKITDYIKKLGIGWLEEVRDYGYEKEITILKLHSSKAISIILEVLPYLQGKQDQANLGIAFENIRSAGALSREAKKPILEELYQAMKVLNAKSKKKED